MQINTEAEHKWIAKKPEHTCSEHYVKDIQYSFCVKKVVDICIGTVEEWVWVSIDKPILNLRKIIEECPTVLHSIITYWIELRNGKIDLHLGIVFVKVAIDFANDILYYSTIRSVSQT